MLPISHPPPCRRLAATSAQLAYTPPSDGRLNRIQSVVHVLCIVSWTILPIIFILLTIILIPLDHVLTSLPSEAAQPASPPLSDDTVDYGPIGTAIGLTSFGVLFIMIFVFFLNCVVVLCDPVPPQYRRVAPLCAPHGRPPLRVPCGLDPAVIKTFPIVVYSAVKGHKINGTPLECAVCLTGFKDDSKLRLIPKCDHAFHPNCIDKWLASHTTCPVCRANLASQLVVHSASQHPEAGIEPPRVEVKVGAPGRSPREDGQEQIQQPDQWDKIQRGSFNDRNRTHGSGGIHEFPRSHSTEHSLTRPGQDVERFTLRLPTLVRKQLIDRPGPVLPLEACPRQGYLGGGEGSSPGRYYFRSPDRLDRATKSER